MAVSTYSPKDFHLSFWERIDKRFLVTLLIVGAVEFIILLYLQSLPVREMSVEETREFQRRIFTQLAPPEVVPVTPDVPEVTGDKDVADGAETEPTRDEAAEERLDLPEEQQQATVQEERQQQVERQQQRSEGQEQIRQAAAQVGLFAAVGADNAAGGGVGDLVDTDVRSSSAVGSGQINRISTGTGEQNKAIRDIRGGLQAGEGDGSGLDVDFSAMSVAELKKRASVGSVQVSEISSGGSGSGGASKQARSQKEILNRMSELMPAVNACFEQQKQHNRDLTGSLVLSWVINTNGRVSQIKIKNARWNNRNAGRDVERCIKSAVRNWTFSEVDRSAGRQSMETKLVF